MTKYVFKVTRGQILKSPLSGFAVKLGPVQDEHKRYDDEVDIVCVCAILLLYVSRCCCYTKPNSGH